MSLIIWTNIWPFPPFTPASIHEIPLIVRGLPIRAVSGDSLATLAFSSNGCQKEARDGGPLRVAVANIKQIRYKRQPLVLALMELPEFC